MKKRLFRAAAAFCVAALCLVGCTPKEEDFDATLLIGKWQCGTLYEKYLDGGRGTTWDTADEVSESEAQPFTWTLEKSTLTQIHEGEMGERIPKTYTVTKLTSATLCYEDDYGKSYTFTKVD